MVMFIETPSSKPNITFQGDLSESDYQGYSSIARVETAPHDGVVIHIDEEDEFGNKIGYKIELTVEDIAVINRVKR